MQTSPFCRAWLISVGKSRQNYAKCLISNRCALCILMNGITNAPLQLETAHKKGLMAETEIREAVANEMEELLRDMEASYKVRSILPYYICGI